jgi:hypothetical protein
LGDEFLLLVQLPPQQLQQEAVMPGHVSFERLFQFGDFAPQLSLRQIGQLPGILLTVDQGLQHGTPRGSQDVGDLNLFVEGKEVPKPKDWKDYI